MSMSLFFGVEHDAKKINAIIAKFLIFILQNYKEIKFGCYFFEKLTPNLEKTCTFADF